jgi:hypothetical protein
MKVRETFLRYAVVVLTALAVYSGAGCAKILKQAALVHPVVHKVFSVPPMDTHVSGAGWTNSIGEGTNQITVLHLTGTNYYSLGYHYGKLLAPQIKQNFENLFAAIDKAFVENSPLKFTRRTRYNLYNEALIMGWKLMAPYVPRAELEEMRGMADGLKAAGISGITVDDLHHVMAMPDMTEATCSALIVKGSATVDGHVYQLRILDFGPGAGLEKLPLITVYHPTRPGENAFVSVGWVGFSGMVSGMNERKVAVSEMGYGSHPGETLAGEPMIFLLKRMLRYSDNAESAVTTIRGAQRNNEYAYGIGDGTGGAYGLITSREQCKIFPVNTFPEIDYGKAVLPQFKDVMYAGHDSVKQCKLVGQMTGKFDLEKIKEMTRQIAMKSNLHVVIYDLTTGDMWIANRHGRIRAADSEYVKFPFSMWELPKNKENPATGIVSK